MIQKDKLIVVGGVLQAVVLLCLGWCLRQPEIDSLTKIIVFILGAGASITMYILLCKVTLYATRYQKAYESLRDSISTTKKG